MAAVVICINADHIVCDACCNDILIHVGPNECWGSQFLRFITYAIMKKQRRLSYYGNHRRDLTLSNIFVKDKEVQNEKSNGGY